MKSCLIPAEEEQIQNGIANTEGLCSVSLLPPFLTPLMGQCSPLTKVEGVKLKYLFFQIPG